MKPDYLPNSFRDKIMKARGVQKNSFLRQNYAISVKKPYISRYYIKIFNNSSSVKRHPLQIDKLLLNGP